MKKKTVVLGLDGATWKLLKPFAEKGYMPTVKKIMEQGVSGKLESTIPAMTAASWGTFATGKHPGKHGIFDFMLPTDSLGNMKFPTSSDFRDKTIYEMLHEQGMKTILVNLPGSYPPKLKNSITITDLLTQGDKWIYPESLKEEFPPFKNYRLTPDESVRLQERRQEYIEDLLKHLEEQTTCVRWLFEKKPWDFFFYLFSHTDWISHLAYTELEEKEEASARRVFEKVDEHLAWFLEHLPKDANLIIVSDHGFQSFKKIFYFNRWLEKEGYLTTNTNADQFRGAATRRAKEADKVRAQKKRININSGVFEFLSKFPMLERAAKFTYHKVVKRYLPVNLKVNVGIDFSKTKVCFPKGSYITSAYINKAWVYKDGTVSKEEYPALRAEVIEKMRAIRDDAGRPIISRIMTREEVYGNDAPDQAPDIFFELGDYWLVGQFQSGKLFAEEIQNKHDQFGIFMALGPDFAENKTVEGLKMQDITPLLLHLLNLPVPSDCDGHVEKSVFKTSAEAYIRDVEKGPSSKLISEKSSIHQALGKIKL
ncbi:MAG: alkaline phosphatase family protein [Candidatus Kerfeldbacteria bacterium]|nr:alkaline phosphatase family protein [Candidatus Kerfeldbacteria bacterium]